MSDTVSTHVGFNVERIAQELAVEMSAKLASESNSLGFSDVKVEDVISKRLEIAACAVSRHMSEFEITIEECGLESLGLFQQSYIRIITEIYESHKVSHDLAKKYATTIVMSKKF